MRNFYRNKLSRLLAAAHDEDFIQLLWATHALQSDYPKSAQDYLKQKTIPDGAATTEVSNPFAIRKWEIETLANEIMTTPKAAGTTGHVRRMLRSDSFRTSLECMQWLRKLEEAESRIQRTKHDTQAETERLVAREDDWMRGFDNIPQFYRNAVLYGHGKSASHFEQQHGISFERFSQIGFILSLLFTFFPVVRRDETWLEMGIALEELDRVLELISLPFGQAAQLARTLRDQKQHVADRPSILRRTPCLRFGDAGERIRAPLPELILERVTSGVFYDIADGGPHMREDISRRFTEYCAQLLSDALPALGWETDFRNRNAENVDMTPDISCSAAGELQVALKCSATRMPQPAMPERNYSHKPSYRHFSMAVFELWSFFSRCRRGVIDQPVSELAIGVVVTLDNWLVLSDVARARILDDAKKIAASKDPEIKEQDQWPISFIAQPELERVLSVASERNFRTVLQEFNSAERCKRRSETAPCDRRTVTWPEKRPYPYGRQLGELLPWWDEITRKDSF